MTIKAVIFDLDNTLYDYDSVQKIALKKTHQAFNRHDPISYNSFVKLYNSSREEIHKELIGTAAAHNRALYFQRMIEKRKNTFKPSVIVHLFQTYWDSILEHMKLKKGVLKALEYCKENGIKVAVASDMTAIIQLKKIAQLGIEKLIDVMVTSEEAGSEKPHSIMFLSTLHKLDVRADETFMVGDNIIADIKGANYVGMKTALLNKGKTGTAKLKLEQPDYIIREIDEIIDIIDALNLQDVLNEGYIKFNCHFTKSRPIEKSKIKELNKYRQKLYNLGLIGAYKNKIGYGNISIKDKEVIITGSATGNYEHLDNTKYSRITKYDILKNELYCTGEIRASSESMTHEAIYECSSDIHAVIHIHSLDMWNRYKNKLPTTNKKASYGTPEIAIEIKRLYTETDLKKKKIAVLGGHKEGIIAFGKDLKESYEIILDYYNQL
jgi:L-ribulose-5-phosphate 4-epimerase